ncbi:MAG: hypothetical protein GDA55_00130 [Cellvibrionales bacterium]|nr:hypothetical protein [Cellvibrionales bacterium]
MPRNSFQNSVEHLHQLPTRQPEPDTPPQTLDLWAPAEPLMLFELELPKVTRRKREEMLPWLLEDRLLNPPEQFEFLLGPALENGTNLIYVLEKQVLRQWVSLATAAGVRPGRMAPDFLVLPYEPGRWTLYTGDGRILVRSGPHTGFAARLEADGWQQLQLLLGQQDDNLRISHLATDPDLEIPAFLAERLDTQEGTINWTFDALPPAVNLLPESYKPARTALWLPWLPLAASATVLLVAVLAQMLAQSWAWQRDTATLEASVTEAYQQIFGEPLTADPRTAQQQANRHLQLLEHQALAWQSTPLAELGALDRLFSGCADCLVQQIAQHDAGLSITVDQAAAVRPRLEGLAGWHTDWETDAAAATQRFTLRRAAP